MVGDAVVGDAIEQAVQRVIVAMRDGLGDELTVDDMARVAMFSKFYFTRIFARVTGVSPGRFLAALRLEQAKRLLVSTSLNVADICMRVGYNSVGTFSSRFARSVGLSPTAYRRLCGFSRETSVESAAGAAGRLSAGADIGWTGTAATGTGGPGGAVVGGHIDTQPARVFVGLFPGRIAEGRPARCAVLDAPGPYRLERVPAGTWYVLSRSIPDRLAAAHGPILVHPGEAMVTANLYLKPMRVLDPPALLAVHARAGLPGAVHAHL